MRQESRPLPAGVPLCAPGHRPQLVRTFGTPTTHPVATPSAPAWHVECHACRLATVPHPSRAITENRWRDPASRIPLSELARARARAALNTAA